MYSRIHCQRAEDEFEYYALSQWNGGTKGAYGYTIRTKHYRYTEWLHVNTSLTRNLTRHQAQEKKQNHEDDRKDDDALAAAGEIPVWQNLVARELYLHHETRVEGVNVAGDAQYGGLIANLSKLLHIAR